MKGFDGRFREFYNSKGIGLLKHPESIALFKRERIKLFEAFRKYLIDNFQRNNGLKLKDFERMLEKEGFVLITSKL